MFSPPKGGASFGSTASQSNISISISIFVEGYDGSTVIPSSSEINEINTYYNAYEVNKKPIQAVASLYAYNLIDPSIPLTVPYSAAVFTELHAFYGTFWNISSQYSELNNYYQTYLKEVWNLPNILTEVTANQASILANNTALLNYYTNDFDAIQKILGNINLLAEFYANVKADSTKEPGENAQMQDGSSWSYGYTSTPKQYASVLTVYAYSGMGQSSASEKVLGHQGHTWTFGSSNQLCVGYDVASNKSDNGHWYLPNTAPLLLTNKSVSISDYGNVDHGINWTVNSYYVDTSLLHFGKTEGTYTQTGFNFISGSHVDGYLPPTPAPVSDGGSYYVKFINNTASPLTIFAVGQYGAYSSQSSLNVLGSGDNVYNGQHSNYSFVIMSFEASSLQTFIVNLTESGSVDDPIEIPIDNLALATSMSASTESAMYQNMGTNITKQAIANYKNGSEIKSNLQFINLTQKNNLYSVVDGVLVNPLDATMPVVIDGDIGLFNDWGYFEFGGVGTYFVTNYFTYNTASAGIYKLTGSHSNGAPVNIYIFPLDDNQSN